MIYGPLYHCGSASVVMADYMGSGLKLRRPNLHLLKRRAHSEGAVGAVGIYRLFPGLFHFYSWDSRNLTVTL